MNRTHASVAVGSLLVGLAGCAHDDGARTRTTISAVTNEEVTGDPAAPGNTRMSYTIVDDEEALNRTEERAELAERAQSRGERARRVASTGGMVALSQQALSEQELDSQPLSRDRNRPRRVAVAAREFGVAPPCERAVFFVSKSAELDWAAKQQLKHVAECLNEGKVEQAMVVGRADPRGTSRKNRVLARERAEAVAEYLRQLGVDKEAIQVRARGEVASAGDERLYPVERRATVQVH